MADELLRQMMNRRPTGPASPDGTPFVPPAPGFRTMPWVTGGPEISKILESIYKVAPELQGQVTRFGTAPTEGVFRKIARSNDLVKERMDGTLFEPQDYNNTNLMGITSLPTKEVWLRKNILDTNDDVSTTAAHEMGHIAGVEHGPTGTDKLESLWQQKQDLEKQLLMRQRK